MAKVRVAGLVLGAIGLFLTGFAMISILSISYGHDLSTLRHPLEIALFSYTSVGLSATLSIGIVALVVNKERKSSYLLGTATVLASLSAFLMIIRDWNEVGSLFSSGVMYPTLIPSILLLLASTFLISYANKNKS